MLENNFSKEDCIVYILQKGIKVPEMYSLGFNNNNCFNTGCVQGGIGYWQKIKRDFPGTFNKMAEMEHKLTDLKGKPVTMLRKFINTTDENGNKTKKGIPLFLKPHKEYLDLPLFESQKGREPKPLMECNGMCGVNDFGGGNSQTFLELNIEDA